MHSLRNPVNVTPTNRLHGTFLALVPKLQTHARFHFRHIACPSQKADRIAETIALAWRWYCRLVARGKDVQQFASVFASLAARAVRSGRGLCGAERANDVTSSRAQRRHNFVVRSLPSSRQSHDATYDVGGQCTREIMEERLSDNTVTSPPDQAAFRIDFSAWLKSLTARERRIIRSMALNERTKDLSRRFEVSPARVSQMRREFRDDWQRYVGEEIVA